VIVGIRFRQPTTAPDRFPDLLAVALSNGGVAAWADRT